MLTCFSVVRGFLTLVSLGGVGLALGGCTTTGGSSSIMQMSAVTQPPHGLIGFCTQTQAACPSFKTTLGIEKSDVTGGQGGLQSQTAEHNVSGVQPSPIEYGFSEEAVFPEQTSPQPQTSVMRIEIPVEKLSLVQRINQKVNNSIIWQSDQDRYGRDELWTMPISFGLGRYGDCEDYALEKRQLLINKGIPSGALALATATSPRTGRHAVLIIRTTQGEYVLDNTTAWVLPWQDTDYQWISMQEGEDLLGWRMIDSVHARKKAS